MQGVSFVFNIKEDWKIKRVIYDYNFFGLSKIYSTIERASIY